MNTDKIDSLISVMKDLTTELKIARKQAKPKKLIKAKTKKIKGWTSLSDGRFQDNKTGLIWGPIRDGSFDHYDAEAKFGASLPTKEEFEEAEKNGIRQVFSMKKRYFWSASVDPDDEDYAYGFDGRCGYVDYAYREYDNGSVVCVSR